MDPEPVLDNVIHFLEQVTLTIGGSSLCWCRHSRASCQLPPSWCRTGRIPPLCGDTGDRGGHLIGALWGPETPILSQIIIHMSRKMGLTWITSVQMFAISLISCVILFT